MTVKLKNSIRYFLTDENTYLRDTSTYKDYLYNAIVYDILQIVSKNSDCSDERLLTELAQEYEIDDMDEFRNDIISFVEELIKDGILESDAKKAGENKYYVADRIREKYAQEHRLFNACIELTYRCNERCIHCYIDDQEFREELSVEDCHNIIDQLVDMGCIRLLLTGGEVSIRPDFIEIAEYASQKGLLIDIYTNGYNISVDLLSRMIALHPNSISFSLYGATPEVHDAVTSIPGSFEKSLKTIMMCKCAGVDTFIKTIALKQNIKDLENLFKLGELLNIPVELAKLLMPSHSGKKNICTMRLEKKEDYLELFRLEEKYKGSLPCKTGKTDDMFVCSSGRCTLSIDPYGNVHPCNAMDTVLGNVRNEKLTEIWDRTTATMDGIFPKGGRLPECKNCNVYEYCTVCLGSMKSENGFRLNEDVCKITKSAYQYLMKEV